MTESPHLSRPRIDYLSRDYASLRQLLLDEFALQLPQWTERHAADLGITLIELLAYAGDYLSYYQDAVAAEAYLTTARQRVSLRRHARLVDYYIQDGLAARVFVHLRSSEDHVVVPAATPLLTQTSSPSVRVPPEILDSYDGMVFETMHKVEIFRAGNEMHIETDGAASFTLPAGATTVQLSGHIKHLRLGDLLFFQPLGGSSGTQAKPHVVRLCIKPEHGFSPGNHAWTTIAWFDEDALPTPIPVVVRMENGQSSDRLCVVRGNLVLADEGRTVTESLPAVPAEENFNPRLRIVEVTHATPYSHRAAIAMSAAETILQQPEHACAAVMLVESQTAAAQEIPLPQARAWSARRDLLSSSRFARDFVAEVDNDGHTCLRFGDGIYGRRPQHGTTFTAKYRVGQGAAGNLGPDGIRHIVSNDTRIIAVGNPLPATGGIDPEAPGHIHVNAPQAYRVQRRCVTLADYEVMARSFPGVANAYAERKNEQEASAVSPVTVYIACADQADPSPAFFKRVLAYLLPFALIGDALYVQRARRTTVQTHLQISVMPGYSYAAVANQVNEAVTSAISSTSLGFGQPVHASQWVAVASSVPGVATVTVTLRSSSNLQSMARLSAASSISVPRNGIASFAPPIITSGQEQP